MFVLSALIHGLIASSMMSLSCSQTFYNELYASSPSPSVASCLASGTDFTFRCGSSCIASMNSFASRIESSCSGQVLLNLGNGTEIRSDTISKYFNAMTDVTCQVAPQGSNREYCLDQLAYELTTQGSSDQSVCTSGVPDFLKILPPSFPDCDKAVNNQTAYEAFANSCTTSGQLIFDDSSFNLTTAGLTMLCGSPCISQTHAYTKNVADKCTNSSLTFLGSSTTAAEVHNTIDNFKSVMCLKNGDNFCINGYTQSYVTQTLISILGFFGADVSKFANAKLCNSCVKDELHLISNFNGSAVQTALGIIMTASTYLVNETCTDSSENVASRMTQCIASVKNTTLLSNSCAGSTTVTLSNSLNPALLDSACSSTCSSAISEYDNRVGFDCSGGKQASLTGLIGSSARGVIQNITNVLCTTSNSQYCILNIVNSIFTQYLNSAGAIALTPTSCAACSIALQNSVNASGFDGFSDLQKFIRNSAAFCQKQPTTITLDSAGHDCRTSFLAAAADVQSACFSGYGGNLFDSRVLDQVCGATCGTAYTKFASAIQDTCSNAVFGTVTLDGNPVDITLNIMFGLFSSFTDFACLTDGKEYCINSIPNQLAYTALDIFYNPESESKTFACTKCSENTRKLLVAKESLFIQSSDNHFISDLVSSWEQYCPVTDLASASVVAPLPTATNSHRKLALSPLILTFYVNHDEKIGGKLVLDHVSGQIKGSKMTVIMGPSGCGKTTLMSILSGKLKQSSGSIKVSNSDLDISKIRSVIGFVPQEDIMYRELTVKENILHSARMRLPSTWSSAEVESLVENVLELLNLSHIQNSIIGDEKIRGISGGQRKRVNIGMELVSTPLCLFLDEPSSGLDAAAALEITDLLSKISRIGVTVIAVIHQPRTEIFYKFDEGLLLTSAGKVAYWGPTKDIKPYFEGLGYKFRDGVSVADTILDILYANDAKVSEYRNLSTKTRDTHSDLSRILVRPHRTNYFQQIIYWHNHGLLQQYRLRSSFYMEIGATIACSAVIGASMSLESEPYVGIYQKEFILVPNSPKLLILILVGQSIGITVALIASVIGLGVFGHEKAIFLRYKSAGASKVTYFIGKCLASNYRIILAGLHFATISSVASPPVYPFYIYYAVITLSFFGVYGISIFVSILVSPQKAVLLVVLLTVISALFCGYAPSLKIAKENGIDFIWYFHFNLYLVEALYSAAVNMYKDIYDNAISSHLSGFIIGREGLDLFVAFLIGMVWRIAALVIL